jgi:hypothetical protein
MFFFFSFFSTSVVYTTSSSFSLPCSYGLVFLNRLGGFIISALLYYLTSPPPTKAVFYEFSFPSVSNMLSSWCQYEALK